MAMFETSDPLMAILDAQPRSAPVRAITDLQLYRLDQEHVYHLLSLHRNAVRAVLAVLCGRVRAANVERAKEFAYLRQVALITAAAQDLEAGIYAPESIDEVARRGDALGRLARVFQNMAREVHAREVQLQRQLHELRIEIDQSRKARQVAEIIGSDYFQSLQQRAHLLRSELDDDDLGAALDDDVSVPTEASA